MKYFKWLIAISILLSACELKNKTTSMKVDDPVRHYYPVLRGQELDIVYKLKNTGRNPLFITDILTSCGCVTVNESSFKVLPAGGKGIIHLKYNSTKNIGYVKHYVTIYANLEKNGMYEMTFDLNVVPGSMYTRDYEDLHREYREKHLKVKTLVEGSETELGYYVD